MTFIPYNRHLLIEIIDTESEKDNGILVPEEYRAANRAEYQLAKVIRTAQDCNFPYRKDQIILVEPMVKDVKVKGETAHLILENYVLAGVCDVEV